MKPLDSKSATKSFKKEGGKWSLSESYPRCKTYTGYGVPCEGIGDLYGALETSLDFPVFMIVGGFKDGIDLENMVRRKRENKKDGLEPTIIDRELPYFPVDVDGWKIPQGLSYEDAVKLFVRQELPREFKNATFIYQFSASHGLTDPSVLKVHLFFWLETPVHNLQMKSFAKAYNTHKGWGNIIDPAIYTCSQPIYTQKRITSGAPDPVDSPLGIVKREYDELNWHPDMVIYESPLGEGKGDQKLTHKKAEFDIAEATRSIVSGENFHDAVRGLALSMMNANTPFKKVKAHIEGIMNASAEHDDRWQERFDDIDRLVETARDIVDVPTFDEAMEWIEETDDIKDLMDGFAQRLVHLDPLHVKAAICEVDKKLKFGPQVLNRVVKELAEQIDNEKAEFAKNKKTEERLSRGLIELEDGIVEDNEIGDITAARLAQSRKSPEIFMSSNGLARIVVEVPKTVRQLTKLDEQGKDYPKMPIIKPYGVDTDSLRRRVNKEVIITNKNGKGLIYPRHILNTLDGISGVPWNSLSGIVENPFVDVGWNVVQESGYNQRTGLFAMFHHKLKLTEMDPKDAYKYLAYEVFDEFPFATELDRATAVGALLTAVQRPSIAGADGFPGFAIVSPTQSSGKTTMAQLISHAAFNRPMAATGWSDDDEEMGKHLISVLMEGHSCVLFDNIPAGSEISSNELAKAMTSDSYSRRKLGSNETISAAAAVLWVFTGNNIQLAGDFNSRVLTIKIMPDDSDPDKRVFKRDDIGQWALDNRKKILSAAISIIMSGENAPLQDKGSRFKSWDKFVRIPLLVASGCDLLDVFDSNKNSDPLTLGKLNLFKQLSEEFKGKAVTAKEILLAASGGDIGTFNSSGTDLKDAIVDIFGSKADNARSVGKHLSGIDGQIFGGLQLCSNKKKPVIRWAVIKK